MTMRSSFAPIGYGLLGALLSPIIFGPLLLAIAGHIDDFFVGIGVIMLGALLFAVLGAVTAVAVQAQDQQSDRVQHRRNIKKQIAALVILVVVTLVTYWTIPDRTHGPDDQVLITNFNQHRALFDQVSQMVYHDKKLQAVYDDHTWPKDTASAGVPPARINDYRNLLHQIGAKYGLTTLDDPKGFELISWSYGQGMLFAPMYYKGYAWLATAPQNVVTKPLSQMNPERSDSESVTYYRHVDANWYLYYQYEGD